MSEPVCLQTEARSPRKREHDVPKSKNPSILQASIFTRKVGEKFSKKFGFWHLQKSGFWREPQNEPQDNLRVHKIPRKVRKEPDFQSKSGVLWYECSYRTFQKTLSYQRFFGFQSCRFPCFYFTSRNGNAEKQANLLIKQSMLYLSCSRICWIFLFPNNTFSSLITRHGTLITLYWSFRFSKWRTSYTCAVTLGFSAAIRWAATTKSGHMVHDSVTRTFIFVLFVMAVICCRVISSSTCQGPAALYSPSTKEVNS